MIFFVLRRRDREALGDDG